MDVATVVKRADGFASAVAAEDSDVILSYLAEKQRGSINQILGALPRPIRSAEVLNVTPPEEDQCRSLTRFNGFRGGVLLRAIWRQGQQQQPEINRALIVDRSEDLLWATATG